MEVGLQLRVGGERRRIDEGLERGARLAQAAGGAVELALAVIPPADDGAHGAVHVHDDDRALAGLILAAVLAQHVFQRLLRVALERGVEGRLHDQHPLVAELLLRGETLHLLEGPVEIEVGRRLARAVDRGRRIAAGGLDLALGEEARLDHVAQNLVRPGTGRRQVHVRGIFGRRLEQACQHRGFRERQVLGRLAEIVIAAATTPWAPPPI